MELHKAISGSSGGKKECSRLSDVYYERDKMIRWKDNCIKQFDGHKSKTDKIGS